MDFKVVLLLASIIGLACAGTTRSPITTRYPSYPTTKRYMTSYYQTKDYNTWTPSPSYMSSYNDDLCKNDLLACTQNFMNMDSGERWQLENYRECILRAPCQPGMTYRNDLLNPVDRQLNDYNQYYYPAGSSTASQSLLALVTSLLVTLKILRA